MKTRPLRVQTVCLFMLLVFVPAAVLAGQSTITDANGYACMGADKSRKQTETEALANAKRAAVENASTYIKSETKVKDFQLEKDLIQAYANATVKVVQELEKAWYRDSAVGDCYRVRIKAEVIPDEVSMKKSEAIEEDPDAPLKVKAWTDKKQYRSGERIRIFLKGNKPFFARVLYKDVQGALHQLLPNPHRQDNYFLGGIVYELPAGNDKFDLEVSPPFGAESVIVYAGTDPLGDISLKPAGSVYEVQTKQETAGVQTRGIKITGKSKASSGFYEETVNLRTSK